MCSATSPSIPAAFPLFKSRMHFLIVSTFMKSDDTPETLYLTNRSLNGIRIWYLPTELLSDLSFDKSVSVAHKLPCISNDFVPLQYATATVGELNNNCNTPVAIQCLNDSGSELCILKSSLLESVAFPLVGKVRIRNIVGVPVEADLLKLHISLVADLDAGVDNACVLVVCAVCPDLQGDMI